MSDLDVAITLRLRDQAGTAASRVLAEIKRSVRDVATGNREVARTAAEIERAVTQEARAYDRVGKSTDAVTRHVRQLNEAARRAVAESTRGADRMAAAWRKTEGAVKSAAGAMRMAGRGIGAVGQAGAGMAAAGYVVNRAIEQPVSFERRLADMSNTAYGERDLAGRKEGMAELASVINASVREGGGSRDSAAEALNAIIASGAVEIKDALAMLPTLQKYSTATGASTAELANIAIRGVQNKYFDPAQISEALDKAIAAGQAGGFELKDMSRWLPQLMASAKGMRGMEGFETILAASQASLTTAGDTDQAGNNLVNLFAKMSSQDAIRNFEKLDIDLAGSLAAAIEKGMNPLDAFVALIDKEVVGKDKAYTALQAKLAAAQGDGEKSEVMGNMADILEGSAVGQIVQDRQALMALVAVMNQRDYMASVKTAMSKSDGAGQANFDLIATTTSYKEEQVALAKEKAQDGLLENIKGPLDGALERIAAFSDTFPGLTTGAYAAATAIGAMTAAATAFAAIGMLRGGLGAAAGAGVGVRAGAAGAAGAGGGAAAAVKSVVAGEFGGGAAAAATAARGATGAGGVLAGAARGAVRALPVVGLGLGAVDVISTLANGQATTAQKVDGVMSTLGGMAGAYAGGTAGAATGALIGSVVPVLGTAIGAALGGILGGVGGYLFGSDVTQTAREVVVNDTRRYIIRNELSLDGAIIAQKVNELNSRDMVRR